MHVYPTTISSIAHTVSGQCSIQSNRRAINQWWSALWADSCRYSELHVTITIIRWYPTTMYIMTSCYGYMGACAAQETKRGTRNKWEMWIKEIWVFSVCVDLHARREEGGTNRWANRCWRSAPCSCDARPMTSCQRLPSIIHTVHMHQNTHAIFLYWCDTHACVCLCVRVCVCIWSVAQ